MKYFLLIDNSHYCCLELFYCCEFSSFLAQLELWFMIPLPDSQLGSIFWVHIQVLTIFTMNRTQNMANISNWYKLNVVASLLLLLVLNFIKEPEWSNAQVSFTPQVFVIVLFADSSYTSMICTKHPTNLALSCSTTILFFHRNPTVQSSYPSWIRIALMASPGILVLPSPMSNPSLTVVLNLMVYTWWCHKGQQAYQSNDAGHKIYYFQGVKGQELHHHGLTSLLLDFLFSVRI